MGHILQGEVGGVHGAPNCLSRQEELQQSFVMMTYLYEIKQMSKVKQLQNTLLVVVGVYQYDS